MFHCKAQLSSNRDRMNVLWTWLMNDYRNQRMCNCARKGFRLSCPQVLCKDHFCRDPKRTGSASTCRLLIGPVLFMFFIFHLHHFYQDASFHSCWLLDVASLRELPWSLTQSATSTFKQSMCTACAGGSQVHVTGRIMKKIN